MLNRFTPVGAQAKAQIVGLLLTLLFFTLYLGFVL